MVDELATRRAERHAHPAQQQRTPPHNLDAEASLLGAMLLNGDAVDTVIDAGVTSADFYRPDHSHIYDAVVHLHEAGFPVDPLTVANRLRALGLLAAGPDQPGVQAAELVTLQHDTPKTSHVDGYAKIVADAAAMRRMLALGGEIVDIAYSYPDDVEAACDDIEQRLFDLGEQRRRHGEAVPITQALERQLDVMEAQAAGGHRVGATTGLTDLDELIGGLTPGSLVTIAARPSLGKTAAGLQVALETAVAGSPALFVSIEMSEAELMARVVANRSRVDLTNIREPHRLTPKDWERVAVGTGQVAGLPLHLVDDSGATTTSIRSAARRHARHGLAVVIVDYLQIIHVANPSKNRTVDVDQIARGLKRIARDLHVCVVALCQLNRGVEARADKRPILSDLRESGQIEQESDVVIGLYRDDLYHPDSPDRGTMELIVLKNRQGRTGTARVAWLGQYQRLANMTRGTL